MSDFKAMILGDARPDAKRIAPAGAGVVLVTEKVLRAAIRNTWR
jgi:hypothetical protein